VSRRHLTFACEGSTLVGTLDEGEAATGLLIVFGGNEVRSGAWSSQSRLAAAAAREGFPVFRFDRRGVGDSDGPNGGFRSSLPDIAAALGRFRAECPQLARVIGFGNCDAASALMLAGGAGCDGLLLSNPWTIEDGAAPPPPEVIRAHYRRRLADPGAIRRLLTGEVSLRRLLGGLRTASAPPPPPTGLVREMAAGIAGFSSQLAFLIAERDRTGQAFRAAWERDDPRLRTCPGATHSYVEPQAREWLAAQVLEMLRNETSSRA
jgi:exosortase A-associated hydrolase 1